MSIIHIKQQHSLGQEEIRHRVEKIAKGLKKEYKINYAWKSDQLLFKRSGASGFLGLGAGGVEVKIKLGLVLSPLKGNIEAAIKKNMAEELS